MDFLRKFGRTSAVGLAATLADLLTLTVMVSLLSVDARWANVPGLIVGAVVQFIGCRQFVFKNSTASLKRQVLGFAFAETGTITLNAIAFHTMVVLTALPYPIIRLLGSFLVFLCFSLPVWMRVFGDVADRPSIAA